MSLIKDGEKVRLATCIYWAEDLQAKYGDNWYGMLVAYLDGKHVECAISPIHDKDTYSLDDVRKWNNRHCDEYGEVFPDFLSLQPKVGDHKKSHVHILLKFAGPKSNVHLSALMDDFYPVATNRWEKVEHLQAFIRYLAHLDSPDKYLYSSLDVVGLGGMDLSPLLKNTQQKKVQLLCLCQEYINDNKVTYYHQLVKWAFTTGDMEIINCVTGRASYFTGYFNSIRDAKRAADAKKRYELEKQQEENRARRYDRESIA